MNQHKSKVSSDRQQELIGPGPYESIDPNLPLCSGIRPSLEGSAGAQAAARALTNSGLLNGQSPEFFQTLTSLAVPADAAYRQC